MCNQVKVTISKGNTDISEFSLNKDKTPGHMRVLVDLIMSATNSTTQEDRQAIAEINYRSCVAGSSMGYISNDMVVKIECFTDNKL